jgi:large subunit ribosomal protein L21
MYAVIKAGGKQQRVKPGDVIEVELMHGQQGEGIAFTPLLVVDDDGKAHVGKDLGKATVKAKLVGEQKGEKVKIFKYRQKTGYKKTQGHRQMYTLVEIEDVSLGRRAPAKKAEEQPAPEPEAEVEGATVPAAEAPEPEAPEAESESVEESEAVGQPAQESEAKEEAEA